jgi:hypothetical protein
MNFREAPLCATAVAKLRSDGWNLACEVLLHARSIDAAGLRDGRVIAVEAKVWLNQKLRRQLYLRRRVADFVLGVVGIRPRDHAISWCIKHKVGIWLVNNEEVIELAPYRQQKPNQIYRRHLINRIERWDQSICGGLPNLRGVGIAQEVQRRVDEYRAMYPTATWKEIFANVPCHYSNHKNLYSALRSNAERLAIRARLRQRQITESQNAEMPGETRSRSGG